MSGVNTLCGRHFGAHSRNSSGNHRSGHCPACDYRLHGRYTEYNHTELWIPHVNPVTRSRSRSNPGNARSDSGTSPVRPRAPTPVSGTPHTHQNQFSNSISSAISPSDITTTTTPTNPILQWLANNLNLPNSVHDDPTILNPPAVEARRTEFELSCRSNGFYSSFPSRYLLFVSYG